MSGIACSRHRHYQAGCPRCQHLGLHYYQRRRAAITAGTWLYAVPVEQVRAHLDALRDAGMTLKGIARAAHLSPSTVYGVVNHNRRTVHGPTAAALLAVKPAPPGPPAGMVEAVGVVRRVRALVASGYSLTHLGRLTGRHLQQIWELAWARHDHVTVATARKVAALYRRLGDTPGPSVRARNAGVRHGWAPPIAWDDDTIDDPAAQPAITPAVDEPVDEVVDEVAIQRVLAGHARFADLHDPDRAALIARLAGQGLTGGQISYRLGTSTGHIAKYLPDRQAA